jgi:hypothetical protein
MFVISIFSLGGGRAPGGRDAGRGGGGRDFGGRGGGRGDSGGRGGLTGIMSFEQTMFIEINAKTFF